ncbi:Gfo/Idh/MocA family protein [Tropicibacter naphthalenivorans]|uniref:Putative oxidoreductase YvaA n=1 Tax=Tropicibacter naphthalenivorans TaxID=441103 RepID=A0A0P1GK95_9RHOB|nr:Gfo/Idh/MocA family oxidoreductase [Tropicibacter naphthalenivorans]CUH82586.1 putative oxidoreductase YvaA [Tropicibacter naphthalenivorans]SMD09446.1 Predicted dehydrogenase [Tropicibacter naphthalenivorans]
MVRIGVVGYGTGGQHFHTPFIAAAKGCVLAGVVARAPATVAKVQADWPDTPIFASLSDMIAAGVCDAVTITTPPHTRRDLVIEAIEAGLHVVADKPFAPNFEGAMELDAAAKAKGITLSVFQNRRLDADLQTLKKVIEDDRLGKLWRIHNRMDFDDPATLEAGPTGGLLRDLGSHLVDQVIYLNGPVRAVMGHLDYVDLPEGRTDASFFITLEHENGRMSEVSASKLNRIALRELRAYGDKGAYVSHSTDVQAQDIFAGKRPADDLAAWGYEPEANWGTLYTATGAARVPSEQGRYHDYYQAFAQAIADGTPPPVTAETGAKTLAVLDAARRSADTGQSVTL